MAFFRGMNEQNYYPEELYEVSLNVIITLTGNNKK